MKTKLQAIFKRRPSATVMGYRIAEPRPTLLAVFWALVYLGLPVLLIGMLLDLLVQWFTGYCTGLWCYL
jgi:hypothetical protein